MENHSEVEQLLYHIQKIEETENVMAKRRMLCKDEKASLIIAI